MSYNHPFLVRTYSSNGYAHKPPTVQTTEEQRDVELIKYLLGITSDSESPSEEEIKEKPKCSNMWSHEWKEYIGFTERYRYCSKCDLIHPDDEDKRLMGEN